jgi:membrane associated rhomboid family serine protease
MSGDEQVRHAVLYATREVEVVPAIEAALERAGIPYRTGLQVGPNARIVFTVAESRLAEARAVVSRASMPAPDPQATEDLDTAAEVDEESRQSLPAGFPAGAVAATTALVLLHLWIVLGLVGAEPSRSQLLSLGALVREGGGVEPWRFVTSLLLHSGPHHVAWNGLALVVFGVPAILTWGYLRAAMLYVLSGIGGGVVALAAHAPGTLLVGSSGAVAGLFGAWLVTTGLDARRAPLTRRAWIRTVGLGLLVLPSLLNPVTADGRPISVAAHLGGLASGSILASLLEYRRARARDPGLDAGSC